MSLRPGMNRMRVIGWCDFPSIFNKFRLLSQQLTLMILFYLKCSKLFKMKRRSFILKKLCDFRINIARDGRTTVPSCGSIIKKKSSLLIHDSLHDRLQLIL